MPELLVDDEVPPLEPPTGPTQPPPTDPVAAPKTPGPLLPDESAQKTDLAARLTSLEARLAEAIAALSRLEQARSIEESLRAARAVDLPTASMLIGRALEAGTGLSVDEAVAQLRQQRPGLFRAAQTGGMSAALAAEPGSDPTAGITALAARAGQGDRKAMSEYLRARRGG